MPTAATVLLAVTVGSAPRGNVFGLAAPAAFSASADTAPPVLVAARPFLALVGVRAEQVGARVAARLYPGPVTLVLDARAGRVRRGRRWHAAPPGELRQLGGEVYVALPLITRLLGVTATYRADAAAVEVRDPGVLPVTRHARHAARWATVRSTIAPANDLVARSGTPSPLVHTTGPVRGFTLDYDVTRWGALVPGTGASGMATTLGGVTVGLGVSVPMGAGVTTVRASGQPGRGASRLGAAGAMALEVGWRWDRPDDGARRLLVRTLRLGDVPSGGVRPYGVRGLLLTNAPPVRTLMPEVGVVRGRVPAGWAVEAFQAGTLVAVDSAGVADAEDEGTASADAPPADSGRASTRPRPYRVAVPLRAGPTAVELVAVGPHGELRSMPRIVNRAPMAVRPGGWEYVLAAGACDARDLATPADARACRGRLNADLRYGVSSRLAVRGGVDGTWWRAGGGPRWRPYGAVSAAPWDATVVEAEAAPGVFDHVAARVQPSGAWLLAADRTRTRTRAAWGAWPTGPGDGAGVGAGRLAADGPGATALTQSTVQAYAAPGVLRGASLDAGLTRVAWAGGRWAEGRVGAALPLPAGRGDWRPYARREAAGASPARVLLGASGTLLPGGALGGALGTALGDALGAVVGRRAGGAAGGALARGLGAAWLTHRLEVTPGGTPWRAELGVVRPVARRWRVDAAADWTRPGRRVRLLAGLSTQRSALRASTRVAQDAAGATATQGLTGSAVWDPVSRRLAWTAEPARERGSVAGTVFLDLDGDGRRGPGEPGVPGARVAVESRVVDADARGRFRALALPGGALVQLALDSASLRSPSWVPAAAAVAVRVPAGGLRTVDVPVVVVGVVEGRVTAADGRVPPGLRVALRRVATGDTLPADVFGDGGFYLGAVAPGAYDVVATAAAGDWTFAPTRVTVAAAVVADPAHPLDAPGAAVHNVAVVARGQLDGPTVADAVPPAEAAPAATPGVAVPITAPPSVAFASASAPRAAPPAGRARRGSAHTPRDVAHGGRGGPGATHALSVSPAAVRQAAARPGFVHATTSPQPPVVQRWRIPPVLRWAADATGVARPAAFRAGRGP